MTTNKTDSEILKLLDKLTKEEWQGKLDGYHERAAIRLWHEAQKEKELQEAKEGLASLFAPTPEELKQQKPAHLICPKCERQICSHTREDEAEHMEKLIEEARADERRRMQV